jgi:NAD+ kinase
MTDMNKSFQTVALIGKYNSLEIVEPLLKLAQFLQGRGVRVLIDALTGQHIERSPYPVYDLADLGREAQLAIVLGGDGTMLNIARTLAPFDVPLVGVNQGRLGFLTDISIDTMYQTISDILDGQSVTEKRMLLQGEVLRDNQRLIVDLAFNDVVVSKGIEGNMVEIEVRIDEDFIYSQRSDGLIIATPTGSTAYALSAGGPIVHPALEAIALIPVSPHTLSNRPIVISSDKTVEVIIHSDSDARGHFDSHSHYALQKGDRIVVSRYPYAVSLLHPVGHSYYRMLREKLNWNRD